MGFGVGGFEGDSEEEGERERGREREREGKREREREKERERESPHHPEQVGWHLLGGSEFGFPFFGEGVGPRVHGVSQCWLIGLGSGARIWWQKWFIVKC